MLRVLMIFVCHSRTNGTLERNLEATIPGLEKTREGVSTQEIEGLYLTISAERKGPSVYF